MIKLGDLLLAVIAAILSFITSILTIGESIMGKQIYTQNNNEYRSYGKGILFNNGFALNETASQIFRQCDGENNLSDIINVLSSEYDVSAEELLADVNACIEEMLENDIITEIRK